MPKENDPLTDEFIIEYGKLREKYRRDFFASPQYVPNGKGGWEMIVNIQVVPLDSVVTPSPFVV